MVDKLYIFIFTPEIGIYNWYNFRGSLQIVIVSFIIGLSCLRLTHLYPHIYFAFLPNSAVYPHSR
jgi:hypothetical protein